MRRIKSYKQFESFFGLFKKPDDDTAKGILDHLEKIDNLTTTYNAGDGIFDETTYSFYLDDFSIEISHLQGMGQLRDEEYWMLIDGVKLNVSKSINKKIYRRVEYLREKPKNDDDEYIRKDAKIHFGKK